MMVVLSGKVSFVGFVGLVGYVYFLPSDILTYLFSCEIDFG
jgi:hypothetical protein